MNKKIFGLILALTTTFILSAQEEIMWTEQVGISVNETSGDITKTATSSGWNSGAISKNQIEANEDGKITYTMEDLSSNLAIGLSTINNITALKSIDYALQITGTKIAVYQQGKFRGSYGKTKIGDEFTLERKGQFIIYKKNGKQFKKMPTNAEHQLYAEVGLYGNGDKIKGNIRINFHKPFRITYTKQDVNCGEGNNGSIDLTIIPGDPNLLGSYAYEWTGYQFPLTLMQQNQEDISGLGIGKYKVIVTNRLSGRTRKKTINILSDVKWTNIYNLEVSEDNLTNISGGTGGANSVNRLLAGEDGLIEYKIDQTAAYPKIIGLTEFGIPTGPQEIDYGIALYEDSKIYIIESNTVVGSFANYQLGDNITIERNGNLIEYRKNRQLLRTVTTDPNKTLTIDVVLTVAGATFNNVQTNFCNASPIYLSYMQSRATTCEEAMGYIDLTVYGGLPPFTYNWSNGSTEEDLLNLQAGQYTVTVTDASGNFETAIIEINSAVTWAEEERNCTTQQTSLYFDGVNNYMETSVPVLDQIGTGDFTLETWVTGIETDNGTYPTILSNRPPYQNQGEVFFFHNIWGGSAYKMLAVGLADVNYLIVNNGTYNASLLDGTPHHVAVTRQGGIISFYADGVLFGTTTIYNGNPSIASGQNIRIGADRARDRAGSIYPYKGALSDLRIWNVARTEAEIATNMSVDLVPQLNLLANWEMRENTGQTVTDKSGNGYDARLGSTTGADLNDPTWDETGLSCLASKTSRNLLLVGEDGSVTYRKDTNIIIGPEPYRTKQIGLTEKNSTAIDYAIELNENANFYIYESGVQVGASYGTYALGAQAKIARVGSEIQYSLNGFVFKTTTTDPNKNLIIETYSPTSGIKFNNVQTSFCDFRLSVDYTTTLKTLDALGSIQLLPKDGVAPYYYFWEDGDQSQFRTNLESGIYTVTVVDSLLDSLSLVIPVGMEISWTGLTGVTTANDVLEKTETTQGWTNGIASLNNEVYGEGEVRIQLAEIGKEWMFGYRLSTNIQATQYTELAYGFYIDAANKLYSWENATLTYLTTVAVGDIVGLEKTETQILFNVNGSTLRQSDYNGTDSYKIDFSLFTNSMKTGSVTIIKFPYWPKVSSSVTLLDCDDFSKTGEIELVITGGPSFNNYNYTWEMFDFTSQLYTTMTGISGTIVSQLAQGWYRVRVTADQYSVPNVYDRTFSFYIGNNVEYTDYTTPNVNVTGTEITLDLFTTNNDIYGFASVNELKPNTDGWMAFKIETINNLKYIGLSENNTDGIANSIEYAFRIDNNYLTIIESGNAQTLIDGSSSKSVQYGDRLSISRNGNDINYWLNGAIIKTTTNQNANKKLLVDGTFGGKPIASFQDVKVSFCKECEFSVLSGENIEFCPDETFQVLLSGASSYLWSPTVGLSCSNCPNPTIDANTAANTYTVSAYNPTGGGLGQNLITNGDFGTPPATLGSYSFLTDYTDRTGTSVPFNLFDSEITIHDKPEELGYNVCRDHTSGSGNMLIVNGANEPNKIIWEQTVTTVTSGSSYIFSYWIQNFSADYVGPELEIKINGTVVGNNAMHYVKGCNWASYSWFWVANSNQAMIELRDLNTTLSGKDYALDDISLMSSGEGLCGTKSISVTIKENCGQEIIGCIFGNYGAGVYVSSATNLNVYCNLLNELGGNPTTGTIEKGVFENHGDINVKFDWINNGQNELFINNAANLSPNYRSGTTDFFGEDQKIGGNSSTNFYNLELGESDYMVLYSAPATYIPSPGGVKTMERNQYVYNTMDLQNSELATTDYLMYIKNEIAGSVYRGSSASPTTGGNGFVSTDGTGYLSRAIAPSTSYFYPMGSTSGVLRYRPLKLDNPDAADEIKVSFRNYDPSNDGLTSLSQTVNGVNHKFYHKINSTSSPQLVSTLGITSYFSPYDGTFQSIAQWENPFWESTLVPNSTLTPQGPPNYNGLIYAGTNGVQNFVDIPYVLAQSGAVIGTPNFPSGDGTSGTSNGCSASFQYYDNDPEIIFNNTSIVSPTATYEWDFGDGSSPVFGQNATHTYTANQTYLVQLRVVDGNNNVCLAFANIDIDYSGSTPTGTTSLSTPGTSVICSPSFTTNNIDPLVYVNDQSSGVPSGAVYTWNFGDGTQVTGVTSASHSYINDGSYTITLTITDGTDQCDATSTVIINNSQNPIPIGNSNLGCNALFGFTNYDPLVTFYDNGSSNIPLGATYNWDFDDGNTGIGPNIAHTYTNGIYYPVLEITDGTDYCYSSAEVIILDENGSSPGTSGNSNSGCTATFNYINNDPIVEFTNTSTVSSVTATYSWDFDDGNTGTGSMITHTYTTNGPYHPQLTVTDGNDVCITFADFTIGNENGEIIVGSSPVSSNGCNAAFVLTTVDPYVTLQAVNLGSLSPSANFEWDFGDLSTPVNGAASTASYTYATNGTFPITLTITDGANSCSATQGITIGNSQNPGTIGSSNTGCAALFNYTNYNPQVIVYNQSTSVPSGATYTWDFGDGTQLNGSSASHFYTTNGTFPITLTITDGTIIICATTVSVTITNASEIVYNITGPCTPGGNSGPAGTGPGTGNGGSGNNVIITNNLPCEYVMAITTNDNCRLDGEIYFEILADLSLNYIKYLPDGVLMPSGGITEIPDLSPEVYTTTSGTPGFTLIATPEELLQSCINSTSVAMGANNDYVLVWDGTHASENIIINSPFNVTDFRTDVSGTMSSLPNITFPVTSTNGETILLTTGSGGLPIANEGSYKFQLHLDINGTPEIIKGQFISQ